MRKKSLLFVTISLVLFFLVGCSGLTTTSTTDSEATQDTTTSESTSEGLLGVTGPSSISPSNAYAQFSTQDDGYITGDCTIISLEGWVTIYEVTHDIKTTLDPDTYLPTGLPKQSPIYLKTKVSQATPLFMKGFINGIPMDVTIQFYELSENGETVNYYTIDLEDAVIVESNFARIDSSNSDSETYEEYFMIGLSYNKITWIFEANGQSYTYTQPTS